MVLPDHKVAITNSLNTVNLIQKLFLIPRKEIRAPVKKLMLPLEKHQAGVY